MNILSPAFHINLLCPIKVSCIWAFNLKMLTQKGSLGIANSFLVVQPDRILLTVQELVSFALKNVWTLDVGQLIKAIKGNLFHGISLIFSTFSVL